MADWPPAGLSISYPETCRIVLDPAVVLKTKFPDGSRNIRRKPGSGRRRAFETWRVKRDDAQVMKQFYRMYGLDLTFTRLALDPDDGDSWATAEMIVTFERPVDPVWIGPQFFAVEIEFYEQEL